MRFKEGYPVIIGLSGEACTGKTVTAQTIVPGATARITDLYWWDHKFLAMPLYALANIRRDITGTDADERQKYEIHNTLFDLFGRSPLYGLPDYDVLYELVYDVFEKPIVMNREEKPRSFLQDVGSLCREFDEDCFTKWILRSINKDSAWAGENDKQYVCLVSDIRMPNEAKYISEQPNGIVIKLTASDDVKKERMLKRDGKLMTAEQANHVSERVNDIPAEYIAHTLDTDELSVVDQAKRVIQIASSLLGVELQTQTSPGEYLYAED